MAKLTKKQRQAIERALSDAHRAQAYIMRPDIAIGLLNGHASTTLHYTRADGSTFYSFAKDIGSDLCRLQDTITGLQNLLNMDAGLS